MPKAKINFEIEEEDLANAKAYVARHGGSLNKLVATLFASLAADQRQRSPAVDPAVEILLNYSAGKLSMVDAANILRLPDAGYVLRRMEQAGIPLPRLTEAEITRQAKGSLEALKACIVDSTPAKRKAPPGKAKPSKARRSKAVPA